VSEVTHIADNKPGLRVPHSATAKPLPPTRKHRRLDLQAECVDTATQQILEDMTRPSPKL
jgi:hypothetical protein